ncbi:MAG: hypothetical protein FJ303_01730 [Planctomycetes bacterium]|nr:hypothetical protein [Planctomycetota bacterium]
MSHKRASIESSPGVQIGLIITPFLDMAFQILSFFIMTYNPAALEGHIDGSLTPPEDVAKKSKDTPFTPPDAPPPPIDEEKLLPKLDKVITVFIDAHKGTKIESISEAGLVTLSAELTLRDNEKVAVRGSLDGRGRKVSEDKLRVPTGGKGTKFTLAPWNAGRTEGGEFHVVTAGGGIPGTPRQIKIRAALDTSSDVLEGSDDPEFRKNVIPKLEKRLKEMNGGKGGDLKLAGDGELSYQYVLMVYDAAKRAGYTNIHFVPPQIKPKRKL